MRRKTSAGTGIRTSALWGSGGRGPRRVGAFVAVAATVLLCLPVAAGAHGSRPGASAVVPNDLLAQAQANPDQTFDVIVQATHGAKSNDVAGAVAAASRGGAVAKQFHKLGSVSTSLTGMQLLRLAERPHVSAITLDSAVTPSVRNPQKWPAGPHVDWLWGYLSYLVKAPAIAIVDSGVDNSNNQFGNRLLTQVDLTSGGKSTRADGRGHGTFVAGLAASAGAYAGAAPTASLVSLKVFNDLGEGKTSDVLRAADWILQNKDRYNIRVANFSLQSGIATSFRYDPLDQAVERLWQAGVFVVAAAGNYASGGAPSGVLFSPANDPFVMTVGALDINDSTSSGDDFNAPWSAYGYTVDGFAKPEIAAPGRYMIEWVPSGTSLAAERPYAVVKGGMQLSGTSFAAPIVSGIATTLMIAHPDWKPDQVKGALMRGASATRSTPLSAGVGEVNVQKTLIDWSAPPNPNAGLNQFLIPDPNGGPYPVFDSASWLKVASEDASWNSASYIDASWNSASWNSASWNSASWLKVLATDNAARESVGNG